MRTRAALAVAVALSASAGVAQGNDTPLPFRIEYQVGSGCPGPEHFERQLRERTQRLVPAATDAAALQIVVRVSEVPEGVEGRLTLVEPEGATTERLVPGSNCVEVLDAMALIAAVTVDPAASLDPVPPQAPPPAPPAPKPPAPEPPAPPPRIEPEPEPRPDPGGWGAGTSVGLESNLAPDPLPSVGVYAELAGPRHGAWAPYARLGVQTARSASIDVPDEAPAALRGGHSQMSWVSSRLLGCPVAVRGGPVTLRPCAFFDLGVLTGRGYVPQDQAPAGESTTWMAAGLAAALELVLVRRLLLGADAGLAGTLRRGEFFLAPPYAGQRNLTVHEIDALAWHAGVRLGFRFF